MLVPHDRRARIPPPRGSGERARDDVPEAETTERIDAATCLVEAGGQTDRVRKIDPGERRSESGIGGGAADALPRERQPQRGVREVMGRLRRKGEQRAPHRPVQVHSVPPPAAQRLLRPLCYTPAPYATRRCQTTSRADCSRCRSSTATSCCRRGNGRPSTSTSSASSPTRTC